MKFCSECGSSVEFRIPDGDNLPRHVCPACGAIHYQNPKVVVGTIPEWEDKILLCRRAIEPRIGLWTVPAGFMENGETLSEGAARETLEESRAQVNIGDLYSIHNLPHINQVYVLFRARLRSLDFGATSESLECRLFAEHEIPWDEIAFRVVRSALTRYYADRHNGGDYPLHIATLRPPTMPA